MLRNYLILGVLSLFMVCCRSLFIMYYLHENVNKNTELIEQNKVLIVKAVKTMNRIDLEQQKRKIRVESIPLLHLKIEPKLIKGISAIIKTDINGKIQDISTGIEILTNKDQEELIGTNVSDLISGLNFEKDSDELEDVKVKILNKEYFLNRIFVKSESVYIINIRES